MEAGRKFIFIKMLILGSFFLFFLQPTVDQTIYRWNRIIVLDWEISISVVPVITEHLCQTTFILEIVPGTWEATHYLVWMPAPIPLGTVLEMEQNRNIIIEAHKVVQQAVIPEITEVLKNINSVFW